MADSRRKRPPTTAPDGEHLLVVAPDDASGLVAATPVLEAAVADHRWRRVSILVEPSLESLLASGPCEVHLAPRTGRSRASWLRSLDGDACLLLTEDRAWVRIARRAGVPVRAGFGGGALRYDLTHAVVPPRDEGRRVLAGAANLWRDVGGLLGVWPDHVRPRLHVAPDDAAALRPRLAEKGFPGASGFLLCAPASDVGPAGLWPPELHAAVLDRVFELRGLGAVVAVGEGDEDLAEEIVASARAPVAAFLHEDGYGSAKAVIEAASAILTTDAFHRSAAAAFGTPCVYLAGPGPAQHGAVAGERTRVVAAYDLECAPCLRARCPLGHHRCMLDLDPEVVARSIERLLVRHGDEAARPAATAGRPA